jgi:hypothetical protein
MPDLPAKKTNSGVALIFIVPCLKTLEKEPYLK